MYSGYDGRTTPNFGAQPLDKLGILLGEGGWGFLLSKEILFIQQLPHEFSSLLGQNLIFLFWIRL